MSYKHFVSADLLANFERIVKVTCGIPRETCKKLHSVWSRAGVLDVLGNFWF